MRSHIALVENEDLWTDREIGMTLGDIIQIADGDRNTLQSEISELLNEIGNDAESPGVLDEIVRLSKTQTPERALAEFADQLEGEIESSDDSGSYPDSERGAMEFLNNESNLDTRNATFEPDPEAEGVWKAKNVSDGNVTGDAIIYLNDMDFEFCNIQESNLNESMRTLISKVK